MEALYVELARRGEPLSSNTARLVRLLDHHGAQALAAAVGQALERDTPRATSVEHLLNQANRGSAVPPPLSLQLPNRADVRDLELQTHELGGYDDLA